MSVLSSSPSPSLRMVRLSLPSFFGIEMPAKSKPTGLPSFSITDGISEAGVSTGAGAS